jgi:hypothetical protein
MCRACAQSFDGVKKIRPADVFGAMTELENKLISPGRQCAPRIVANSAARDAARLQ